MTIQPVREAALRPLYELLRLNTDLLYNCLDGLRDEHANRRLGPHTNSIAFLVVHILDARHYIAKQIGTELDHPLGMVLAEVNTIDEVTDLPELSTLRSEWDRVSRHLEEAFPNLGTDILTASGDKTFPVDDGTVCGALAFLLQHESYHIGQVALIRKQLGYPAMSYERRREQGE